jgi:hypothetical protein
MLPAMTSEPLDPTAASTDFPAPPTAGSPAPVAYNAYQPQVAMPGQIGKVRGTGICILLTIVTLGIYPLYWYYQTHEEMKRHSGQGLGGLVALLLGIFVGIVMPYLTSSEVGGLYERRGQKPPVSGLTGLWYFPGIFILVGPIVWFVKTNGALNAYWRSLGAGQARA